MFNIMNLNHIQNIFYWTDNNGAVSLPGDTALTYRTESDLPRFVAAVYGALNTDSGVSERVVTLNGHCGLLLDVLYDKSWISETFSNLHREIPDEVIMNLFGAALPCLAQAMANDIRALLCNTEHCSNCPDLRILVGQNTDKDGHELCFFIPFGGTEFDHDERIRCAHAARVVESYLDRKAYSKKVEAYIRKLVDAANISVTTSENTLSE